MNHDTNRASFGAAIDAKLKDEIDKRVAETRVPMQVVVETAARWLANLPREEFILLCYNMETFDLGGYIDRRIAAYLKTPEARQMLARDGPQTRPRGRASRD